MGVLVTGGAGFVGSHLCEYLHAQGRHVFCVDSLLTGRLSNINSLRGSSRFEFIEHDVEIPLPDAGQITEIYNLACPASPVHYQRHPVRTIRTNVLGMMHVLDLAARKGARVLQASTSEIYGDAQVHPQPETYWGNVNSAGPRACYDEGKRLAEALCYAYRETRKLDVRMARIFNTYGPRMRPDDGRVVSNFIVQALAGEDLTVYGDGEQTRSFCYVNDMVRGLVALMKEDNLGDWVFNIGNPRERTVEDLASHVLRLTSSRSSIRKLPLPEDDPRRRCPDISRITQACGWMPDIDLEQGLVQTIDSFRD